MLNDLTASEKAQFLGKTFLAIGVLTLGLAIAYFSYQLHLTRQDMSVLLSQIESTSQKLGPVLQDADSVSEFISPILEEARAIRKTVDATVNETAKLREVLPPIIASSINAIDKADSVATRIEPHIKPTLEEVKQTRLALPGIINNADKVVRRAEKVGKDVGKRAVTGVLSGIITAPFRLIGEAGKKALSNTIGLGKKAGFTKVDERLAQEATDAVLKTGKPGNKQDWKNPDSGNRGSVHWLSGEEQNGLVCVKLRYTVIFKDKKSHVADVDLCQQKDGSWKQQ